MATMKVKRGEIAGRLFPGGIPKLWCPPLTHFANDGTIDEGRMASHLKFLAPWVHGLLVPGTTGEGWELTDSESSRLIRIAGLLAQPLGMKLLIGILKPSADAMVQAVGRVMKEVGITLRSDTLLDTLSEKGIAGFTFCAPRGTDLTQKQIEEALRTVLDLGLPSALYQIPQVTGSEVAPDTAYGLGSSYENLLFVKDSSGDDRILSADGDRRGVFFLRGAEGDYYEWCRGREKPYDGFLLSTANCFPEQLSRILSPEVAPAAAASLSRAITEIVNESFHIVSGFAEGNQFTNANKAIDHFNAYGAAAGEVTGPRLHGGAVIPKDIILGVGKILERHGMLPKSGYLQDV